MILDLGFKFTQNFTCFHILDCHICWNFVFSRFGLSYTLKFCAYRFRIVIYVEILFFKCWIELYAVGDMSSLKYIFYNAVYILGSDFKFHQHFTYFLKNFTKNVRWNFMFSHFNFQYMLKFCVFKLKIWKYFQSTYFFCF